MNFDYGYVLTRALQVTWRHKSFWLFMIVPVLVSFLLLGLFVAPIFFLEGDSEPNPVLLIAWVVSLVIGLLTSMAVSTMGLTSLSLGILRVEKEEGATTFIDLLRDGLPYFWRALGIILILQLTIGAVFTIFFIFVALLIAVTMGMAAICLQPVMILLTPLSLLVVAVMEGGILALMDEDLGAWEAVKRAFAVVRTHVWRFIILIVIVYFGATIVTSILMFPAMFPAMLAPIALESGEQAFFLMILLFSTLFMVLTSVLSGVSGMFITAAIEIAYLRLVKPAENEVIYATPMQEPE